MFTKKKVFIVVSILTLAIAGHFLMNGRKESNLLKISKNKENKKVGKFVQQNKTIKKNLNKEKIVDKTEIKTEAETQSNLKSKQSSTEKLITETLSLSDIPESELKNDLLKLDEKSLKYAISTLESLGKNAVKNDVLSLNVDKSGGIFYSCKFDHPEAAAPLEEPEEEIRKSTKNKKADVSTNSPPIRHSNPGAPNVLYLDFNGGIVSNTAWERDGIDVWDCKPFDLDGVPSTFNDDEQSKIILFWELVAEDFAPFDVDVTTEQPPVYPDRKVGWVMITETLDENGNKCPHNGYGGIAYVNVFGSFNYPYYSPAWVTEYSYTYAAEASSHELGHNMGLSHDGTDLGAKEYYKGHNDGVIYWNAIMGGGSSPDVSQWCKGEYYDANQTQDDLDKLDSKLGYRNDDHGDDNASASLLDVEANGKTVNDSGYIETTGNPDVFKFSTVAGAISITATPYKATSGKWGSNLDIELELRNEANTLIASDNPERDVVASITEDVPAGIYYLHVKPTGVGNPMNSPPTGYTIYGSLGSYSLAGTIKSLGANIISPDSWATGNVVEVVTFIAEALEGNAAITNMQWSFGDGSSLINGVNLTNVDYTYLSSGEYTAKFTVFDADGFSAEDDVQIVIIPEPASLFLFFNFLFFFYYRFLNK